MVKNCPKSYSEKPFTPVIFMVIKCYKWGDHSINGLISLTFSGKGP